MIIYYLNQIHFKTLKPNVRNKQEIIRFLGWKSLKNVSSNALLISDYIMNYYQKLYVIDETISLIFLFNFNLYCMFHLMGTY